MWYPVYRLIKFSIETHVRFEVTPSGRKRRSADFLDEIDKIEENATSFILDGEMKMPDGVEVVKEPCSYFGVSVYKKYTGAFDFVEGVHESCSYLDISSFHKLFT